MMYCTLEEADIYFQTRLYSTLWEASPSSDRIAALTTATRQIDRLSIVGEKHAAYLTRQSLSKTIYTDEDEKLISESAESQPLQFPRGSDIYVPTDIKLATMELAYELLDGRDPQRELENLSVVSQGYSSVRNTNNRSFVQEHLNAGIVSLMAWKYLRPYLRDDQDFKISRAS